MPTKSDRRPAIFRLESETGWLEFRYDSGVSIARRLKPGGAQPSAFGAPPSTEQPYRAGDWIGSVDAGGSCNCFVLSVNPHCNGTHTESIGHVTRKRESVLDTGVHLAPFLARLVTLKPSEASNVEDRYEPEPVASDRLIDAATLRLCLASLAPLPGLILRVLDADEKPTPYFSHEAMRLIRDWGADHLLINLPSVDRAEDEGLLTCHRIFWNLSKGETEADAEAYTNKTITELIHVPDHVPDGIYAVQIQLPPIEADALPSEVLIYPPAKG